MTTNGATPDGPHEAAATTAPPWAQPGVTDVPIARSFLAALRAPDVLVMTSNDADVGTARSARSGRLRGHGVTVASTVVAATPPPAELVAYHRSFGLGAARYLCPAAGAATATLADLLLADRALVARIRADPSLARILLSFKNPSAARLIDTLGLAPTFCAPEPAAYEAANDKLALARAGRDYGFPTLAAEAIGDESAIAPRFRALGAVYGAGCIMRLTRGTSGRHVHHVRNVRHARRIWRRLAPLGHAVILLPYVSPALVRRNVAVHGIVTADGFAPLVFTDQLVTRYVFRGGSTTEAWAAADLAAVHTALAGVARWFRDLGYVGAPAGIDGMLVDGADGPRFLVLDPNARLSATMGPWAALAVLAEHVGRPLPWRLEGFRLLGGPLTLGHLRRRLAGELLAPDVIAGGGIFPTTLTVRQLGPLADNHVWALLIGRDAEHVAHLRRRLRGCAVIAR